MRDITISEIRRGYLKDLAAQERRVDGRGLEEFRPVTITTDYIGTAEGSSKVTFGASEVVSGVKLGIAAPYPDQAASGVMMTNVELRPLAAHLFELGPPRPPQIELSRVVDRAIRESKAIELQKLCVKEGEKVWMVFIDGIITNHGGNLFDLFTLGSIAALMTSRVPAKAQGLGEDYKLPIQHRPIAITSWKLGDQILVDATLEEELVADARLTVATNESEELVAMQKGGDGSFSREEVEAAFERSAKIGRDLRKQLEHATGA